MCEYIGVTTLDTLCEGEQAYLERIDDSAMLGKRLGDLGWTAGTPVRCLRASPLGDPVAYGVRGAVIALRRSDSKRIWVCRREVKP